MKQITYALLMAVFVNASVGASEVVKLWPGKPPGEISSLPPEADTTDPDDRRVAGRRVTRLGNVSTPTLKRFQPAPAANTGAAVIICPGGGHHILAYDLEGTEVARWLQSIGVTGIVLKYRVPARDPDKKWKAAVQDAQRAVSFVRHHAGDWQLDSQRIGILGFSAGGQTAALTAVRIQREYEPVDAVDDVSHRPDFAALIYPAYLTDRQERKVLEPEVTVDPSAPPIFMVHAFDDAVPVENSLLLYLALKRAGVPAELHAYASGGHGFGMRRTIEPCTAWPEDFQRWLAHQAIAPVR